MPKKPSIAKPTAIYVRVSSRQQDTALQEREIEAWKKQHCGTKPLVFRDSATGSSMDRPGWVKLWAAVLEGQVERIVIWRLDRLGRTASGLTQLFEDLQARKINLVSLRDGLDLQTPSGRLMANVLASVAQFETEVRSERKMAGIAKAKAEGKTWGGSKKGRRLTVTDEQAKAVFNLRKSGEGITAISRATGLSRPTVYRILGD